MISKRNVMFVLLTIGLVAAGAESSLSSRAHATTYALVCNNLSASSVFAKGLSQNYDNGTYDLRMDFTPAAQGDNSAPVPAGTCAWKDRALRGKEPACIGVNPAHWLQFQFNRFNTPSWRVVGCDPAASNSPECGFVKALTGRQVFLIGSGPSYCMNVVGLGS